MSASRGSSGRDPGRTAADRLIKSNSDRGRRLRRIAEIIEAVDERCLAHDGPVGDTREEMSKKEMQEIYDLAKGRKKP